MLGRTLRPKSSRSFYSVLAVLLIAIVGSAINGVTDEAPTYVGARKCAACHGAITQTYQRSGHPFKLQKVDGGPPRFELPEAPGVPSPPEGMTWADVAYVVGGYGWKARFLDSEGYILTGPDNRQYNLASRALGLAAGWTGYDADSAPRKPYTCGACHATGWVATGPDGPHQDGLPGIHGTWAEPGVTCEACHGPGSAHASNPVKEDLTIVANCNSCHIRGDVTQIDAADGLIKHHEQYEDLLASPHNGLECTVCHDPHRSSLYEDGFKGQESTCLACHGAQAKLAVAPKEHNECTNCHMPFAGKSAVSIKLETLAGPLPVGDIRSHIFRINRDPDWQMFTDDGKFVRVDDSGKAHLSTKYTCLRCHQTRGLAWAAEMSGRIHAAD